MVGPLIKRTFFLRLLLSILINILLSNEAGFVSRKLYNRSLKVERGAGPWHTLVFVDIGV